MRRPRPPHLVLGVLVVLAWAAYLAALRLPGIELSYPLTLADVSGRQCQDCGFVRRLSADSLRIFAPLDQLPSALPATVVAFEDQRFFVHRGVDWAQLWRAARRDLASGRYRYGASTITMQLARTLWLTRDKTLTRKVREIAYALALERRWPKERILETYLNQVDFGRHLRGVGAAACYYFGIPASELSGTQAMTLAAMLPDPDRVGGAVAESPCAATP